MFFRKLHYLSLSSRLLHRALSKRKKNVKSRVVFERSLHLGVVYCKCFVLLGAPWGESTPLQVILNFYSVRGSNCILRYPDLTHGTHDVYSGRNPLPLDAALVGYFERYHPLQTLGLFSRFCSLHDGSVGGCRLLESLCNHMQT